MYLKNTRRGNSLKAPTSFNHSTYDMRFSHMFVSSQIKNTLTKVVVVDRAKVKKICEESKSAIIGKP